MIDRSAARARILARHRDETAGPPNGTEVALRCTDHGRFIAWVSPPTPPCRVACPTETDDDAPCCIAAVTSGGRDHIPGCHN